MRLTKLEVKMPIAYMTFWSIVMIIALSIWRLRHWGRILVVCLVTAFVLILSQSLFIQLSVNAGLEPSQIMMSATTYLRSGPMGWLAFMVMPCGWLGPFLGFSLVQRWSESSSSDDEWQIA
jgi:hypothetical protein